MGRGGGGAQQHDLREYQYTCQEIKRELSSLKANTPTGLAASLGVSEEPETDRKARPYCNNSQEVQVTSSKADP